MPKFKIKTGPTERESRRRNSSILLTLDDAIGDMIAVATIREQSRLFGIDRVRGL